MTPAWEFSDAWVLAAISGYRRPCSLPDLIAAADGIQHAIVGQDELEESLGKLTSAGLVRVFEDWTFETTDQGGMLWPVDGRDLEVRLKETLAQLANFEPGRTVVTLPRKLFEDAIDEYRSR